VKLRLVAGGLAALTLVGCATPPPGPAPAAVPAAPPEPVQPPSPTVGDVLPLAALPGWGEDDHAAAFAAFRASCGAAGDADLAATCRNARALGPLGEAAARRFFESRFVAVAELGEGVLTGYFAPLYEARHRPDAEFSAALRGKPADLKAGAGSLYPERAAIEAAPAAAPLAWMRPEDAFFLQTQGSGALLFEDGRRMKALYAGTNGRPFVAIGNIMRQRGLLASDQISAGTIHAWLAAHRGPDADALMRLNPRYAFFRLAPDDGRPPTGAAGLPLPAGRAVAVDTSQHPMGELLWIDGHSPMLAGAKPSYRRLVVALDTGGGIKGAVRADLYLGQGEAAGREAGLVRHALTLYRLAPRPNEPTP
jgi:membrane-bound lytic murein transglycosylase A